MAAKKTKTTPDTDMGTAAETPAVTAAAKPKRAVRKAADTTATADAVAPKPRARKSAKADTDAASTAPVLAPAGDEGPADQTIVATIQEQAYFIWLGEGQPEGRQDEHWLRAEEIVRARFHALPDVAAAG